MSPLMIIAAMAMRNASAPPAASQPPAPPTDDHRTSLAIKVEPSDGAVRRRRR